MFPLRMASLVQWAIFFMCINVFKGKKIETEIFSSEIYIFFSSFSVFFLKEEADGNGLGMELKYFKPFMLDFVWEGIM